MGSSGGGDNLDKMVKNCMKITKSSLLGQNSGGQANFRGSGGDLKQVNPIKLVLFSVRVGLGAIFARNPYLWIEI